MWVPSPANARPPPRYPAPFSFSCLSVWWGPRTQQSVIMCFSWAFPSAVWGPLWTGLLGLYPLNVDGRVNTCPVHVQKGLTCLKLKFREHGCTHPNGCFLLPWLQCEGTGAQVRGHSRCGWCWSPGQTQPWPQVRPLGVWGKDIREVPPASAGHLRQDGAGLAIRARVSSELAS